MKFSGFVALSKFCVLSIELFHPVHFETYAGFPVLDLTGHHFMCFKLLKFSMLKKVSYLSSFKTFKNYSFGSVLVGVKSSKYEYFPWFRIKS